MSLRAFHLFFIAICVILAAFCGAWATGQYRATHEAGFLAAIAVSVAGALALVVYGTAFQRKTRSL